MAGDYDFVITDANGCTENASIIIGLSSDAINVDFDITNVACSVAGSICITVSGGQAPYEVLETGETFAENQQQCLENVDAGTYTYSFTDAAGCVATATAIVEEIAPNTTVDVSIINTNPTCVGNDGFICITCLLYTSDAADE